MRALNMHILDKCYIEDNTIVNISDLCERMNLDTFLDTHRYSVLIDLCPIAVSKIYFDIKGIKTDKRSNRVYGIISLLFEYVLMPSTTTWKVSNQNSLKSRKINSRGYFKSFHVISTEL